MTAGSRWSLVEPRPVDHGAELDVLDDAEAGEQPDVLPGAGDPGARAIAWAGSRVASTPSMVIVPALGKSAPEMVLSKVVLPEPLGPISPTISPGRSSRPTPSSARRPAKSLVTPATLSVPSGSTRK